MKKQPANIIKACKSSKSSSQLDPRVMDMAGKATVTAAAIDVVRTNVGVCCSSGMGVAIKMASRGSTKHDGCKEG